MMTLYMYVMFMNTYLPLTLTLYWDSHCIEKIPIAITYNVLLLIIKSTDVAIFEIQYCVLW